MIKRILMFMVVMLLVTTPALATMTIWSPSEAELDSWAEDVSYSNNGGTICIIDATGPGLYTNAAQVPVTGGWWAAGIGLEYLYPNGLDLTGYDGIGLTITNISNTSYMYANLHLNTGWVPTPGDNHYQNGDNWLAPGETKELILDFVAEGVVNLDQGTRTVLQIAGYSSDPGWYFETPGDAVADCAHVQIVPEPATICFLGLGVAAAFRKKRS